MTPHPRLPNIFVLLATIVAGETVVAEGELTDARPGRLVRGPQG